MTLSRPHHAVQAPVQPPMIDRRAAISLLLTLPLAAAAHAQAYPDRPIRMILPFAPGGVTDVSARYVAQLMSLSLGQSIIIENRSGGGGSIATTAAARAEPDGYTLLVASSATHSILPAMFEKLDYDPIGSFAPIAGMSIAPYLLVVNADVPVANAGELAAYARANPGKLNFAAATGTPPHILAFVFKESTGTDFGVALYRGGAPAMADLMANQVQAIFQPTTIVLPLADDKRVRILGIAAERRSSLLPDVPTLAEQGLPQLLANSWNGLVAPAGTPEPVIQRLNQVVNDALDSPALKSQFSGLGITSNGGSPEKFGAFMRDEAIRWADFVKASKLPKVR
jgi:tripartite-type tricarboxylate transporter receptor subunit TctC